MNIKNEIIRKLESQKSVERSTKEIYQNFASKIKDQSILEKFKSIILEEEEHVEIVGSMIKIALNQKEIESKAKLKDSKIKDVSVEEETAILLLSSIDRYMFNVISLLTTLSKDKNIIYVSYNKLPKYIKKALESHDVNMKNISFISCVRENDSKESIINPQDLTGLSIKIEEISEEFVKPVVIIDNVSGFSVYHDENTILEFVSSMSDKARQNNYSILWVAIDGREESRINKKLSVLCDEVLKFN